MIEDMKSAGVGEEDAKETDRRRPEERGQKYKIIVFEEHSGWNKHFIDWVFKQESAINRAMDCLSHSMLCRML